MREVLFRGKRKSNGEWVYGNYCGAEYLTSEGIEHLIIEVPRNGSSAQVIPETISEFTGLTDKNGKKIFEGDIFSSGGNIYKVIWLEKRHGWYCEAVKSGCSLINKGYAFPLWHWNEEEENEPLEVIGNIHDNPELLKGE